MLEQIKFQPKLPRANEELRHKLKFLCIWIDIVSINLLNSWDIQKVGQVLLAITQGDELALNPLVKGVETQIEFAVFLEKEL